jgi:hypothetical protein
MIKNDDDNDYIVYIDNISKEIVLSTVGKYNVLSFPEQELAQVELVTINLNRAKALVADLMVEYPEYKHTRQL